MAFIYSDVGYICLYIEILKLLSYKKVIMLRIQDFHDKNDI